MAFGPDQYARFFGDAFSLRVLADTLQLGAEVAMLALFLAYPLGLVYVAARPLARSLITFLILLPLLTSTVVRTFAWIVILGREGIVNSAMLTLGLWDAPARLLYTWSGLIVALTQIQLPLMALPVINSLLRLDRNLVKAAEGLGAIDVVDLVALYPDLTKALCCHGASAVEWLSSDIVRLKYSPVSFL